MPLLFLRTNYPLLPLSGYLWHQQNLNGHLTASLYPVIRRKLRERGCSIWRPLHFPQRKWDQSLPRRCNTGRTRDLTHYGSMVLWLFHFASLKAEESCRTWNINIRGKKIERESIKNVEHGSLRFYYLSTAEVRGDNPSTTESVLIAVSSSCIETLCFPTFCIWSLGKTSVPSLVLLMEFYIYMYI